MRTSARSSVRNASRRCWGRSPRAAFAATAALAAVVLVAPRVAGADQRDQRLRPLLDQLAECKQPLEGDRLTGEIWSIWNSAGDDSVDRLMVRATEALERGELLRAIQGFTRVIERRPDFAEGWNKRATTYYKMRDYDASIRDVMKVLELEPRHFAAIAGMGLIYSHLNAEAPALRWFERALAVNPCMPGIREQVDELRDRLEGGRT